MTAQVDKMEKHIRAGAAEQVAQINEKADADCKAEKNKILSELMAKADKEFAAASKKIDSKKAIARSTAINSARLEKVSKRADFLDKAVTEVRADLEKVTKDQQKYKALLVELIVQGCMKLLEVDVKVRCRQCDMQLVAACIAAAESKYQQTLLMQSKKQQPIKLTLDNKFLAPPPSGDVVNSCLGGVVLACHNGLITVDNTLDTRLRLVVEQDKPTIRATLYPN